MTYRHLSLSKWSLSLCPLYEVRGKSVHIKKTTDSNQLYELSNQWDELLSLGDSSSLPLTHGWISAWWKEFNTHKSLCIFSVYKEQKLIAIAPFYEENSTYRGIPVKQLHLLSDGHSPYCDIIYDDSLSDKQITQVLTLIVEENKNDLIIFSKIPKTSPTYSCLLNPVFSKQFNTIINKNLITPTIKISGNWDEFFKKRSRKFIKNINNKLNRFKKETDFTIDCENVSTIDHPVLSDILEVSKKSWKASIKADLGSDIAGKNFLLDLVDTFGSNNHIQVWILRKNSIPVAYEFHVIYDNIVYPIRADYDENYKKYSPGSILEYTALKYLFDEQRVTEYYTCADNYWYLNNWSNDLREHFTIELFSSNFKAHSLHFIEKHMIPIARYIKAKLQTKHKNNSGPKETKIQTINQV